MTGLKDEIFQTLRWRLGAASIDELAKATGRDWTEVLDALCELEAEGLVEPRVWATVQDRRGAG